MSDSSPTSSSSAPSFVLASVPSSVSRQGTVSTVPKSADKKAASAAEGSSFTPSIDAGRAGFQPRRNAASSAGASAPEADSRKNHWLAVRLIGTKSNRDAIGASLKLTAGDFVSYDQSKGGMSYCSAQDPRIYFGLGARDHVDALEIRWPSGAVETYEDLAADQILTITEGAGIQRGKFPRARPH